MTNRENLEDPEDLGNVRLFVTLARYVCTYIVIRQLLSFSITKGNNNYVLITERDWLG